MIADEPLLRKTGGKKVFELRPNIDWDKGKAVLWLLEALDLEARRRSCRSTSATTKRISMPFGPCAARGISFLVAEGTDRSTALPTITFCAVPQEAGNIFLAELSAFLRGKA